MRAPGQLTAGETVASYRVETLLGRGGMGEVYLAHDDRLERPVALKVLAPPFADDDEFRERLLRESRLAASLDHPNVVPVYEAGDVDGRFYLAMRYVEGTDLRAVLRREGTLEPERAVVLGRQVADALDAAHARGLVHRDVKPSNVLIADGTDHEHCYLADFGLTQHAADRGPADGSLQGTADYVAPEQIRGDDLDGRADQYSLACMLYECLTGRRPFEADSDIGVIYAHLEGTPEPPSARLASLPRELDAVLARGLDKAPDARFESCRELVDTAAAALGVAVPAAQRWRFVAAATVAAGLVVAAAIALVALLDGGSTGAPAPAGGVVRIDPGLREAAQRFPVGEALRSIAAGSQRVWVGSAREGGGLWQVDPSSGEVRRIPSNGEPKDMAYFHGGGNGAGEVYVVGAGPGFDGNVTPYTAVAGERGSGIALLACSIAAGETTVYTSGCPTVNALTSTPALAVAATSFLPWAEPQRVATRRVCQCDMAVAPGEVGALWVLGDAADRRVFRLDGADLAIDAIVDLPFAPRGIAADEHGAWVTSALGDEVALIDARSNRIVATVDVGRGAAGVASGEGAIWVANALDGTVSRIDPRARRVTDTIDVGGRPLELTVADGSVWVLDGA